MNKVHFMCNHCVRIFSTCKLPVQHIIRSTFKLFLKSYAICCNYKDSKSILIPTWIPYSYVYVYESEYRKLKADMTQKQQRNYSVVVLINIQSSLSTTIRPDSTFFLTVTTFLHIYTYSTSHRYSKNFIAITLSI